MLSCEKKEAVQILPVGKVVTFEWADTVGGTLYGIMREQETGKPHVAVAELKEDGSFVVTGLDGAKNEPVLQLECHCNGCGYEWCPNMKKTYGNCIACPASGHQCTNPFFYLPCSGGYCIHIWIQ